MKVIIDHVTMHYNHGKNQTLEALAPFSLTIKENEFVALVGPSGCGKSTLLNMVGGFLTPSTGKIYFTDLIHDKEPLVGNVFQDIGLFPWLTVKENISFGLEEMDLPKSTKCTLIQENMSLVGLTNFADSYPHQLSGGMQQRVGIARALAIQPDLLLMDEPFSALDAQTRQLMQEELLRILTTTKLTTLYVTHNINEAVYLADRIVVLSGRPGTIKDIIQIDIPRHERDQEKNLPLFTTYIQKIWHLIRKDAEAAVSAVGAL